jgi:N-acetylglucosaminyldiphosphoundecaprenol N-acetyl-beta-D-mannosaminyltransferase
MADGCQALDKREITHFAFTQLRFIRSMSVAISLNDPEVSLEPAFEPTITSHLNHNGPPAISLLGIPFANVTAAETLQRIEMMIESRHPHYVVTANVDFLVQARSDAELRSILLDAHLVLCDGMPLVWASRLLQNPLPERVTGADLVPELIRLAAKRGYRIFLLGASPDANEQAAANLRAKHPGVEIVGHYSPPFRPLAEMDNAEIMRRIRDAQPDIVLVAFGCPKAEKWIARHYQSLGVPVMIGVGGTLDFIAGRMKRAPTWMQRCGAEWMFRLCQEPKRLFGRYFNDLWRFGLGISQQCWQTALLPRFADKGSRHCVVTTDHSWRHIHLPERLDYAAVRLAEWLWQNETHCDCLLDLKRVRFIDSTGVGLLLRLRKELRAAGKHLVLLSPSRAVRRILRSMRVLNHFVVVNDVAEADELIGIARNGIRHIKRPARSALIRAVPSLASA